MASSLRERRVKGQDTSLASDSAKSQEPPSAKRSSSQCLLPDGGHRAARVGIAAPAGAQAHRAIVQAAVHAGHALPRPTSAPGDVQLVAGAEPGRLFLVVDRLGAIREHPRSEDARVRERPTASHGRDVGALSTLRQIEGDPADPRLVPIVPAQEPQAFHVLAPVRVRSGQEQLPPPELGIVDVLDARAGRFEGLDDPIATLAEGRRPHLEAAEGVLALGPVGRHALEVGELRRRRLLRAQRAEGVVVGGSQTIEGLLHRDLERVGVASLVKRRDPPLHELIVSEELLHDRIGAAEAAKTTPELSVLVRIGTGHKTCLLVPTPTSLQSRLMRSRKPAFVH